MTTALYAAVCLIWGSTWLVIRLGMNGIPSFLSAGLRFTLAAGLSWRMTADGRKSVLMAGFLNFGAAYALVYWSEMRVASGLVASLYALEPLTIALLTAFVTRTERLTRGKAAGVAIGVAGTLLVCWPESGAAGADAWGLTAALASMLLASVNLVAQSLWSRRDDARVLNAWSMSVGAAILLLLSLVFERGGAPAWTLANAAAIVYLALAGSVAAFLIYYRLIRELAATEVSLMALIFPVVALALGRAVLGERVSQRAGLGIALILGGVGLALWSGRLKPAAAPA